MLPNIISHFVMQLRQAKKSNLFQIYHLKCRAMLRFCQVHNKSEVRHLAGNANPLF